MVSNNKQGVFMIVVVVLLVLALGYIGFIKYSSWSQANEFGAAQYGYNQAILTVAEQAATCQQVPLMIGNQTINLVAVECPELVVGLAQQIIANSQQAASTGGESIAAE